MVGTTSGYEAAVDQFVTKMRRRCTISLPFFCNSFENPFIYFKSVLCNSSALLELPWEALSCVEDLARREGRVLSFSISLVLIGFESFFVMDYKERIFVYWLMEKSLRGIDERDQASGRFSEQCEADSGAAAASGIPPATSVFWPGSSTN